MSTSYRFQTYDVYQDYVQFKIYPTLQGAAGEIISSIENGDLYSSGIQREVAKFGRACAMSASLSIGSALEASMMAEYSDIVYADSLLTAYFIMLRSAILPADMEKYFSDEWLKMFRNDIDYLILQPDSELNHLSKTAWKTLDGTRNFGELSVNDYFYDTLCKVSLARLNGHRHPYSAIKKLPSPEGKKRDLFIEGIEAGSRRGIKNINIWLEFIKQIEDIRGNQR